MKTLTPGQISLIYEAQKPKIKEALNSDTTWSQINDIGGMFGLDKDEQAILGLEVVDIIMGLIPKDKLGSEILKDLKIDGPKSEQIAQKINDGILSVIEIPEFGIIPEPETAEQIDRDRLPRVNMNEVMKKFSAEETPKPFKSLREVMQPPKPTPEEFGKKEFRSIPIPPPPPAPSRIVFSKNVPENIPTFKSEFKPEELQNIKYGAEKPKSPLSPTREQIIPTPPKPPGSELPKPPQTTAEHEVIDLSQFP